MMALAGRLLFVALLHAAYRCVGIFATVTCESPQYVVYGEIDFVNCLFHDDFFSVLWFDTIYYTQSEPILHYQDSTRSGAGFESGEFDIFPNGSLVINNVSLQHDTTFTVAYVHTRKDAIVLLNILVVVVVKPKDDFPLINYCGNSSSCFAEVGLSPIQCSVSNVRPNVTLKWLARTVDGHRNMTEDKSITPEGVGYTTRVTARDVFNYSLLLELLVCKAFCPREMLKIKESIILVQNNNIDILSEEKQVRYIERYARMNLDCTGHDIGFFVWKKVTNREKKDQTDHEVLLYSILIEEQWTAIFENDVFLGKNASLVVSAVEVGHDGLYYCIYGDGLKDGLKVYEVIVKVDPVPPHPVIEGCDHQQYCVLETDYEGSLTCKLKGIRPQVELEWVTFPESESSLVSFTSQTLTVKDNGETFDVTLTSMYGVMDRSLDRLTIECRIPDSYNTVFHLTTKMDLLFGKDNVDPTNENSLPTMSNGLIWRILIILISIFLILMLLFRVLYRKHSKKRKIMKSRMKPESTYEVSVMLPSTDLNLQNLAEIKDQFLRQIKEKYRDLYDAVQPIPYIKDQLYCVDNVFVEGGIEFLDSTTAVERLEEWKNLKTYQNIFNDPRVKSTRRILEGEPGYGKSTVTLQFAYDWCKKSQDSALKDVGILVLLRLRQLGGVPSIYRAIKQFILPKDTTLSEKDIEEILKNCASVVVILDGFDEYPDQDNIPTTDVMNIIARQIFQEFEVLTTTRSSFLPNKYPPLTKRIRLTGFDDMARRYYIRKAVVGEDDERVTRIEEYLDENPVLSDLCQVPLLFVIFAHMTHESENFRKLNSVTSFFRYMISGFHSHMRNKMKDEHVPTYELFENDHRSLDKAAFDGLHGRSQKIVWQKEELCQQIGLEFYNQYIRIGILVEEEVLHIIDDSGTLITEHIQYKTEVRFYHKLFCEWYAAHYLSEYIQQTPNVDLSEFLQHLDPFDVQYMYHFSCGINDKSAEKIISYVKNIEGGDKFAILCVLEKTGKIDHIKETIRQMCFEGVVISGHDSHLLQRSSMQLLKLAARNDIPIEYVRLYNCLSSSVSEISEAAIKINSDLVLSSGIPIKKLRVTLTNREMTEDEAVNILKFSSMCPSLRQLVYTGCILPLSFNDDCCLKNLRSRAVKVKWRLFSDSPVYILNLHTGRWMNQEGLEPTTKMIELMQLQKAGHMHSAKESDYQKDVNLARDELRRVAEQRQAKKQDNDSHVNESTPAE